MTKIREWDVENDAFWAQSGRWIAFRNLVISIPCLLLAFAVWIFWSILIVQMESLGFSFTTTELYTLPAVAGLAGATLRIPNSFVIAIGGGRNVVGVTTALLILPTLGVGIALQDPDTTYMTFVMLAILSGVGGGAFASSMSNISFFFPKRMQGLSLGLNAGLGNVGVSVMQVLLPWVMGFAVFGALSGSAWRLPDALGGGEIWIQNAGLVWVPALAILTVLAFMFMNNLPQHDVGAAPVAIGKILWLELMGFGGAAFGVWLLLGVNVPLPDLVKVFLVLGATIGFTLLLMKHLTPGTVQTKPVQAIRDLRGKAQLGDDLALCHDVRLVHRVFGGFSQAHPRRVRELAG